jgi:hypothetical protein
VVSFRRSSGLAAFLATLIVVGAASGATTYKLWHDHAVRVNNAYAVNQLYNPTMTSNLDDPTHPLLTGGITVPDITSAASSVSFAVPRPHVSFADDDMIQQTMVMGGEAPEVAIRYSSGVRVYVKRWPDSSDPAGFYKESQARTGAGVVTTIDGHPCWYADKGSAGNGFPTDAFVDMTVGNVDIVISGPASLSDLLTAAASVN